MPRCGLLGSIIISIASLTLAQNSTPTSTSSTQTTVATQPASGVQLADASRTANVAPNNDALPTTGSLPIANATAASKPRNSTLSEKNNQFDFDRRPRLVFIPRFNLNGAGFGVSESVDAGADFESKHFKVETLASYNNARKTNDGTVNNQKGHIRSLGGSLYYRFPNYCFFGTSGSWGELSTTNYTKQMWGMKFGGGTDFIAQGTSFRLSAAYAPSAFDHRNGSQGPSFQFVVPSPLQQRHVMFEVDTDIMFFHATITDPNDPILTEQQKNDRSHSATSRLGLIFRF
jgi:hypothetical protein